MEQLLRSTDIIIQCQQSHRMNYYHQENVLISLETVPGQVSMDFNEYSLSFSFFLECRAWVGWCSADWLCTNQYEYQMYFSRPPPPCPRPPYIPPAPGVCQYNFTTSHCHFHHSSKYAYSVVIIESYFSMPFKFSIEHC